MSDEAERLYDFNLSRDTTIGWYDDGDAVIYRYPHPAENSIVLEQHQLEALADCITNENPQTDTDIGTDRVGDSATVQYRHDHIHIDTGFTSMEMTIDQAHALVDHLTDSNYGRELTGIAVQ